MQDMQGGNEAYLWFTRPQAVDTWEQFKRVCPVRASKGVYGCENGDWYVKRDGGGGGVAAAAAGVSADIGGGTQ